MSSDDLPASKGERNRQTLENRRDVERSQYRNSRAAAKNERRSAIEQHRQSVRMGASDRNGLKAPPAKPIGAAGRFVRTEGASTVATGRGEKPKTGSGGRLKDFGKSRIYRP